MTQYVLHGNIQAQPLITTGYETNPLLEAVLTSVMGNDEPSISVRYPISSIPNEMLTVYQNNFDTACESYFNYANAHNPYVRVPGHYSSSSQSFGGTSNSLNDSSDLIDIINVIETNTGRNIEVLFYSAEEAMAEILFAEWLVNSVAYTPIKRRDENIFAYLFPEYIPWYNSGDWVDNTTDKIYRIDQNGLDLTGTTLTINYHEVRAIAEGSDIYDTFFGSVAQTLVIDLLLTNSYTDTTILHHVVYRYLDDNSEEIWLYDPTEGTYPELDIVVDRDIETGLFNMTEGYPMPRLVYDGIRLDKEVDTNPEKELIRLHTERMLDKLGIDLTDFLDNMEDPSDPDSLQYVISADLVFAINFNDNEHAGLVYINEVFRRFHYRANAYTQQNYIDDIGSNQYYKNSHTFSLSSSRITTNFTAYREVVGQAAATMPVPDFTTMIPIVPGIDPNSSGRVYKDELTGVTIGEMFKQVVIGTETYNQYAQGYNTHVYILRKQLTPTTYSELFIHGLTQTSTITHPSYYVHGLALTDSVKVTLADLADGAMYLPLNHGLLGLLDPLLKVEILMRALQIIVRTGQVEKKDWYTNPAFLLALQVFSYIFTWGVGNIFVNGFIQGIKTILVNAAITYLAVEGLMLLADLIGGEIALIITAIAVAYSFYMGEGDKAFNMLTSEELMHSATLMMSALNKNIQDDYMDLLAKAKLHEELMETKQEELDKLNGMIDEGSGLEWYEVVSNRHEIDTGETPSEFFNRSCHLTNPGVLSLDATDFNTSNALTLPAIETNPLHNTA